MMLLAMLPMLELPGEALEATAAGLAGEAGEAGILGLRPLVSSLGEDICSVLSPGRRHKIYESC